MKYKIVILLILLTSAISCGIPDKEVVIITYKKTFLNRLDAHIFFPNNNQSDTLRSVFIFFHGGGWGRGEPEWEYGICRHFASKGMVAMSIEYRLANRLLGITPVDLIKDAKSSVRWVRENSEELSIDTNMIVVGGFSAGGHLAACTGIIDKFYEQDENLRISSIPNATILWSACVNPVEKDSWFEKILGNEAKMEDCSPVHNLKTNVPPTIIFHGESDSTVKIETIYEFTKIMQEFGNKCELNVYKSQQHKHWTENWKDVYNKIEIFLEELGYIESENE